MSYNPTPLDWFNNRKPKNDNFAPRRCVHCNGRGLIQVIGNFPCDHCAGTGKDHSCHGMDPFFPCGWCKGTGINKGSMTWHTCNVCRGSGVN